MKRLLLFSIPLLALLYGAVDYLGICDSLSGQTLAQHGYERLRTLEGGPDAYIFEGDKEFHPMMKFILRYSPEIHPTQDLPHEAMPSAICWAVNDETQKKQGSLAYHNPQTFRLGLLYGLRRDGHDEKQFVVLAGLLDDLPRWIERDRNTERFLVNTVLLSLLSVVLAFFEIGERRNRHG